jgi:hypothetical protein
VVESGTQATKHDMPRRRAGHKPVQTVPVGNDHAHGLALAAWRSSPRSAFGQSADHALKPVFGLWEKDDAGE